MRDHRIRERRMRLDLTQAQLGELAGFPVTPGLQSVISAIERGQCCQHRIPDLRRALLWEETKARRQREELRRHERRVAAQEALWAALPECPAKDRLLAAMLDRCLDLMHEGSGEACDAIAEWLPKPAVMRMFDQWEAEAGADRKCSRCAPEPIDLP